MSELKPCPFCGSENTVRLPYNDRADIERCKNCNLTIIVPFGYTMWNTRPIEDALNARIAELEAEVTKCHELQDAYCDRIAELEAAQRWIPVSERLPEIDDGDVKDYDVVLAYTHRRTVIVAKWGWDDFDKTQKRRWFDCDSDEWGPRDITEYVTHWRERPTPPEVQECQ